MARIFTIYLVMLSILGFGQTQISGHVFSGTSSKALKNVHVRCEQISTKTEFDGSFTLECPIGSPLTLSSGQFNTQEIPVNHITLEGINNFYLTPSSSIPSQIIPDNETEVIYMKNFEHVSDYVFVSDTLLILTYLIDENFNKSKHVNCAITAFKYGVVINRKVVPSNVSSLFNHPTGNLYMYAPGEKYKLDLGENYLTANEVEGSLPLERFDKIEKNEIVYSVVPTPIIPKNSINRYDLNTGESYLIRVIENHKYFNKVDDDFEMLTEYQFQLAHQLSQETGVKAEMLAPYIRNLDKYIGYKRPYTPVFTVGDTLLIFDHFNQWLYFHELDGVAINQVSIYHNNLLKEDLVSVIQDPISEKLYTHHNRAGLSYIRLLNVETGATGRPYKLNSPFPRQVKILNGYIYYLSQSAIDKKTWHLLREELPL